MNKPMLTILICLSFITISTVGCVEESESEQNKIIGIWLPEEELYKSKRFEFFEDGTCFFRSYKYEGTYELNETERKLTVNVDELSTTFVYTYVLTGNRLILTNEDTFDVIVYTKQE